MSETKDSGLYRGCALTVVFGSIGVAVITILWVIAKTILDIIGN